jgi:DNA-binding NarL/FixJ family response regulator
MERPSGNRTLRIAVVDPSPEIRAAVAALVESTDGVAMTRQADSLAELLDPRSGEIDVLVAEIRSCLDLDHALLEALRVERPQLHLIVTSISDDPEYAAAAATLAADAWLPKARLAVDLPAALKQIAPR